MSNGRQTADSYLSGIPCEAWGNPSTNTAYFDDPVCGRYGVSTFHSLEKKDVRAKVASVLAERKLRRGGGAVLLVDLKSGDGTTAGDFQQITVAEILKQYPRSASAILEQSLINLGHLVDHPSQAIKGNMRLWPLLYAFDVASAQYVLRQLEGLKYIAMQALAPGEPLSISIEAPGWAKIDQLKVAAGNERRQAFVAMSFDQKYEHVFSDGIAPAVESDGTICQRIDRKEHNNKICDEIIAEIRRSRFVVADFTGQRGGVYFEAGYAQGLGIPVIWCVHKGEIDLVHFDTRQYSHIVYESTSELKDKLVARIAATIPPV